MKYIDNTWFTRTVKEKSQKYKYMNPKHTEKEEDNVEWRTKQ